VAEFDSVIPPGGVGKVTAEVNTGHFKGPIAKSVTVTANDPAHATSRLTIKADVKVAVDVDPRDFLTLQGNVGELQPLEATVYAVGGETFDITAVDARAETMKVEVTPVAADGSALPAPKKGKGKAAAEGATTPVATGASRYKLTITPTANVPAGRSMETITVKTSHPKAPEVQVRVSLFVKGPIEVLPERLDFVPDPTHADQPVTETVTLKKTSGDPLAIESVTATNAAFSAKLRPVTDGREYAVDITYTPQATQPVVSAQLVARTNVESQKTITVQLLGRK